MYRGQSNSDWLLKTSLHRTGLALCPEDIVFYIDHFIPIIYKNIVARTGQVWDLSNCFQLAQFLAYLQHNCFPTPLLDWTRSPYIAAFFAFDGIKHYFPQYDYTCIYCFDKESWLKAYKQSYDYKDKKVHVSILEPSFIGNPKQLFHQGLFMYTNVVDIEEHIERNQKSSNFIQKYRFSSQERPLVMEELKLMNINSMQLFPSVESVCNKVATDISLLFPMGNSKEMEKKELILDDQVFRI